MGYKLPNGGTFQHAATYAAALAFTAISNATEAVAAVADADLEVGDIVLVESGWSTLNGRVVRVKTATAVSITLEDIDTSDTQSFPAGSGGGTLKKIETWVQIPQITDVAFSGGEQQYTDVVFLEDMPHRNARRSPRGSFRRRARLPLSGAGGASCAPAAAHPGCARAGRWPC